MDAHYFRNCLCILTSVEVDELRAAGVIDENWGTPEASERNQIDAFIRAPFDEALRMPDANFERLFALIESRQPTRRAV